MGQSEFRFGDWQVSPEANALIDGDVRTQLEPRVMAVLRYLCRHPGAVIPAEELLQACWGSNELGDNPVHKAITQLRRALGDSSTEPRYIETIRKRGYRAIAAVVELVPTTPAAWTGSPFRGLEAFQENHAAIFFGRVQATARLRELVQAQAATGCAMALVLGPSGSGKTSLVRAGLLPQLMEGKSRPDEPVILESTAYLDCADLGSGTLYQALAGALIDADIDGAPMFAGASADSLGHRLESSMTEVLGELARFGNRPRVGMFIDRLEAILRAPGSELNDFIQLLDKLARCGPLLVVLACRNDFYPDVVAQPLLMELKARGGHFDLLPPDAGDIAQIVRQPIRAAGLAFEQDPASGASLDDVLCDAARGSPDTLPLLQYCLNELYRQRSESGHLCFKVFHQLGGIDGAVGVRAEQVVSSLNAAQIAALPHVLSLIVNVGDELGAITARRSALSMLRNEDERALVGAMIEARLFVSELAGDVPSFGVAHEALLRQWPRVVDWINQHRNNLELRTRIAGQTARWVIDGRPADLLLPRGSQVVRASELLQVTDFALTPTERDYIQLSVSRSRRGERLRVAAMGLILLLAFAATALGLKATTAQHQAERSRADAESLMAYMLGDFVEKLRPLGRLDLLDGISAKALSYLTTVELAQSSIGGLQQRAKALQLIAEVNTSRANAKQAEEALRAARKILETIDRQHGGDKSLLIDLGANAFWIGQTHLNRREWDAAASEFSAYLEYSRRISQLQPNDKDGWIEQSYAHNNLGTVNTLRGNLREAAESYRKSAELKRIASAANPSDTKLKADIANSLSWLADTKVMLGEIQESDALYQEAIALLEPIHEASPGESIWSARLGSAFWSQAVAKRTTGKNEDAYQLLNKAQSMFQEITKRDATNLQWAYRLAVIQNDLRTLPRTPAISKAESELFLKRLDSLVERDPNRAELRVIALGAHIDFAHKYLWVTDKELAIVTVDKAVEQLSTLHQSKPDDGLFSTAYANGLLVKAQMAKSKNGDAEARPLCEMALKAIEPTARNSTYFSHLVPYLRTQACLGSQGLAATRDKLKKMQYNDSRFSNYIYPTADKGTL